MEKVVLLNSNYSFLGVIHWKRAISLVVRGKVEVIKATDRIIRNASRTVEIFVPKVIRLVKLARMVYRSRVPYNRKNVLFRDKFTCQYCGIEDRLNLTVDHVHPTSKGGKSEFENCVAACKECNTKKDSMTMSECGMTLKRKPFKPTVMEFISIKMKLLGVDKLLEDLWE